MARTAEGAGHYQTFHDRMPERPGAPVRHWVHPPNQATILADGRPGSPVDSAASREGVVGCGGTGTCGYLCISTSPCMFSTHVSPPCRCSSFKVNVKERARIELGLSSIRGLLSICFFPNKGGERWNLISSTYTARTDKPAARRREKRKNDATETPKSTEKNKIPTF